MRIGKVEFVKKPRSWQAFYQKNKGNRAMLFELSRIGHTLESAYEKLTGKKADDNREAEKKAEKSQYGSGAKKGGGPKQD